MSDSDEEEALEACVQAAQEEALEAYLQAAREEALEAYFEAARTAAVGSFNENSVCVCAATQRGKPDFPRRITVTLPTL